ncbi:hypothetical protein A2272_05675 [Candidatus Peregrinibacteria bacterium RIFOXYA12_FULL_33_12]|nr:MAG: hypothetical protein A2272_05675 [Candidatus Peregrinibacteria bacterium RIFOXYA12_FULL_33_12]
MSLQDKAKLLFADKNLKYDTIGKESLLTAGEEDLLIKDAQKNNQIRELNRINNLFNLLGLLIIDVRVAALNLELAISYMDTYVMTIYLIETHRDKVNNESVNDKSSYFTSSDPNIREPNATLQAKWDNAVHCYKELCKKMYMVEYVNVLAGINLISNEDQKLLDLFKKQLESFCNLEGLLGIMKLYKKFFEFGLMKESNIKSPFFLDSLKQDIKEALELIEEEKEEAKAKIDKHL